MRCTQNYFCYCDLQTKDKQLNILGRTLNSGKKDTLQGFKTVQKPNIEEPFIIKSKNAKEEVKGTLYRISFLDLHNLDEYEKVFNTKRITAKLKSGKKAWVYVDSYN